MLGTLAYYPSIFNSKYKNFAKSLQIYASPFKAEPKAPLRVNAEQAPA